MKMMLGRLPGMFAVWAWMQGAAAVSQRQSAAIRRQVVVMFILGLIARRAFAAARSRLVHTISTDTSGLCLDARQSRRSYHMPRLYAMLTLWRKNDGLWR